MSVALPLPPTSRDLLVYERITVDCASTREVAAALGISQTRVRQIVKKVLHWLAQTLPDSSDLDEAAALRVAQHIAADRLQRYLVEANQLWEHTGETRYMGLCIRILTAQSKIPAFPGELDTLAADAIEGPLEDEGCAPPTNAFSREQTCSRAGDTSEASSTVTSSGPSLVPAKNTSQAPSVRDCSPKPTSPASDAPPQASQPSPSSSPPAPSADLPPTKSAARKAFLAPAHPLAAPGDEPAVTEIKITPQELGFTTTKPLSRRERRLLRRKMQSK